MGNRVHVVKKQREYGKSCAFNWAYEEFKTLLRDLGCNVCEQDEYSSDFEMEVDDYSRAMKILQRIKDNPDMDPNYIDFSDFKSSDDTPEWAAFDPDDYDFNDVLSDIEKLEGYSIDDILDIMQTFYDERDKNSGWIQFCSF